MLTSIDAIIKMVSDLDSKVYTNAMDGKEFYCDYMKWSVDYSLATVKEKLIQDDMQWHSYENEKLIAVLQRLLERLNYKQRRRSLGNANMTVEVLTMPPWVKK